MPEIAEVRTVARTLNKRIVGKTIIGIDIIYDKTISSDINEFKKMVVNKTIKEVSNYGKWIFIDLGEYTILSHLRMEGKYYIKDNSEEINKHEHVLFHLDGNTDLRYHDTRKFGRMKLIKTSDKYNVLEIKKLGIEPDSDDLTVDYLYNKIHHLKITIKEALLDQTIINGLGNIYDNEVLFASRIKPTRKCNTIKKCEVSSIIDACNTIIKEATLKGGTTIRSYTSSLGVTGSYQNYLKVHDRKNEPCVECNTPIEKITVGGRGTYYCKKCQK